MLNRLLKFTAITTIIILPLTLIGAGILSKRRATAYRQHPTPQAILVLDGSERRIRQAVTFAQQHANLPVWVSGNCTERPAVQAAFGRILNDPNSHQDVLFDLRATDTVTHFTTLIDDFTHQDIHHVYIVTSDYHLSRALVSARLIFGSRGIVFTPVSLPSNGQPTDPAIKSIRDGLRSLLWLTTRRTGASFNPRLRHLPGGVSCPSKIRRD